MKAVPIKEKEYGGGVPRREKRQRQAEMKGGKRRKARVKKGDENRRKRITIAGASDSTISGNDRKKERSFVRTKRTVEERSAKKNES